MVLEFNKTGYAAARVEVERASRVALDVALLPEPREIVLSRSGVDGAPIFRLHRRGFPASASTRALPCTTTGRLS